ISVLPLRPRIPPRSRIAFTDSERVTRKSVDPDALKIPARKGGILTNEEPALYFGLNQQMLTQAIFSEASNAIRERFAKVGGSEPLTEKFWRMGRAFRPLKSSAFANSS